MSADTSRVKQWKPPRRPAWVERINEEGRYLDLKAVVPLDEQSLLDSAKRNTGLSDFGADDWHEPFQVLIKSLEEDAQLTLMGRLMTRSDLLMHLEARLRVEETYRRFPEITDQQVDAPILIVGSGRSGTSAMLNILSLDPGSATLRSWEALFPCPPPEASSYRTDPRIQVAHQRMDMWNRVTPEIESMHEFSGEIPTELIHLETLSFQNNAWLDLYGLVPGYNAYLTSQNFQNSLKYAQRVLKLLQWKNPHARWVLKSPDAMRYMPEFFGVFPGTHLVWMHRDPIKCVASMVSLIGTLFWIRSDQPLSEQAIGRLTNPAGLAGFFDVIMDQIEQNKIPARAIHHIQYLDFVADPLATVETLYREMNIPFTDAAKQAMQTYLREHPRESRPAHKYAGGDSARLADERKLFERYQNRFHVKSEL